jgi:CheY-like chemotaxis protein
MWPEPEDHPPAVPGAGPNRPSAAQPFEARIAAEQLALMYGLTPAPVWASVVFAALLTPLLLRVAPQALVLGWAAVMLALCAVRATETSRFRADPQRDSRGTYWRRRYLALMVLYCLCWSALFLLFADYTSGVAFALLLAGMVAIAGVGVLTTFGVMTASLWFVGALLGPLVLWFLRLGGTEGLAMAGGGVLYAVVLIQQARRSQIRQAEMLRLRLENAAIAEQRAQALALADQASRAKSRFLAAMSHEMRTPLNGIVGMSELIRDEASDDRARHRIDVVLRSAEQLHRVIGDLLDLSRLELGHPQPDLASTCPSPAAQAGGGAHDTTHDVSVPPLRGRVLVVDDNEVNALVAQAMLTRLGMQTDSASDGDVALERLLRDRFDAVLMDCRMPRLDGWQATRRWRVQEQGRRLPIIGVTANVSEEDRRACMDAGMDAFLGKPYRLDDLAAVLRQHLAPA